MSSLSRTSSVSSVASDNSAASSSARASTLADPLADNTVKRTRKRFTSVQLMMLEHLYGRVTHPTRQQREKVAREADIDIRSVTVWFQNKRQTDRRISREASEALSLSQLTPSPSSSLSFSHPQSSPTTLLPPSSPFCDASGNTIHNACARTRTLSGDSSTSALSAMSRKRERERDHERDTQPPPARHIRHKPSRHLSLDDVAARAERPALLPRTPPQTVVAPESSSSPARPLTPEPKPASSVTAVAREQNENQENENDGQGRERALWENMPSSPIAPHETLPPHSERDIVRYAGRRRRITLEYACARETVGVKEWEWRWLDGRDGVRMRGEREKKTKGRHRHHHEASRKHVGAEFSKNDSHRRGRAYIHAQTCTQAKKQDEEEAAEEDIPVAEYDAYGGGDTDTEGAPTEPPVTPSSSFNLGEFHGVDDDELDDGDSDRTVTVHQEVLSGVKRKDEPMGVARIQGGPDDDLMDVAYVLCGLSQRR